MINVFVGLYVFVDVIVCCSVCGDLYYCVYLIVLSVLFAPQSFLVW